MEDKKAPTGAEKFITRWAHSFKTSDGNVMIFDGLPTHPTEENAKTCRSGASIADLFGLEDAGPVPVRCLKEDTDVLLTAGVSSTIPTPMGYAIAISGPVVEAARSRMIAEGQHVPDLENEEDRKKAWEEWQEKERASLGAELVQETPAPNSMQ